MAHRRKKKDEMREERTARREAMSAKQRKRIALGVGAIAVAFLLIAVLLSLPIGPSFSSGAPSVGQPAPNFAIVDIDGNTFQLLAQTGHPVLLDFMGSNCPSCVAEMPDLRLIYATYSSRGLAMISIDIGGYLGTEDSAIAREFMTTNGGSWPIALDNANLAIRYGVPGLPTLYIIDPNGIVAYRNSGHSSATDLGAVISRYV